MSLFAIIIIEKQQEKQKHTRCEVYVSARSILYEKRRQLKS